MKNVRQGDILFSKTEKTAEGKPQERITIAEGEVTGHHHVLVADVGSKIIGDKTHFTIKGTAKLVHPEHDTIPMQSGSYVVSLEREYDYAEESMRQVVD